MAFSEYMNFKTSREQLTEFDFSAKECSNWYVFSQEIGVCTLVCTESFIRQLIEGKIEYLETRVYAPDFTVLFSMYFINSGFEFSAKEYSNS